jgi:hypothetical protein
MLKPDKSSSLLKIALFRSIINLLGYVQNLPVPGNL